MKKLPFLHVKKTDIVDDAGKPVMLKGVALGGWLMMEGYMMCGRNIPEKTFKEDMRKALGPEAVADFTRSFRSLFIREEDIEIIKSWGANCIRVPFNYRVIEFEDRPFSLNEEGLRHLDDVVGWCEKYGIYCILDMHAAPGAQNPDWHADCVDKVEFFTNETNQDRFYRLWHFIADRYKDVSTVAGYDILNEPYAPFDKESMLKDIYERATKEIRDADKKHIIFLEGNFWSQRLKFLSRPKDKNTAYSVHGYPLPEFTFNWEPDLHYPGRLYKIMWDRKRFEMMARHYYNLGRDNEAPIYVGEFGVNWRGGYFGELKWTKDLLDIFKKFKIHWTYWTYKTIANSVFPDGIYRYVRNPAWINRKGPVTGWENFYSLWPKEKGRIMFSWRTENFKCNDKLLSLLKRYL